MCQPAWRGLLARVQDVRDGSSNTSSPRQPAAAVCATCAGQVRAGMVAGWVLVGSGEGRGRGCVWQGGGRRGHRLANRKRMARKGRRAEARGAGVSYDRHLRASGMSHTLEGVSGSLQRQQQVRHNRANIALGEVVHHCSHVRQSGSQPVSKSVSQPVGHLINTLLPGLCAACRLAMS